MKRILFLLVILGLAAVLWYLMNPNGYRFRERVAITSLNSNLISSTKWYQYAFFNKDAAHNQIIEVAKKRKEVLEKQMVDNPAEFLKNTLTENDIAILPDEVKELGLVEERQQTTGKLVVTQYDDFSANTSHKEYHLEKQAGGQTKRLKLYFTGTTPYSISGAIVNVTGMALGEQMVVDTQASPSSFYVIAEPIKPTGLQKVVVILFNFLNDRSEPASRAEVLDHFMTASDSVKNYLLETSANQTDLTAETFGYYTIPFEKNTTYCDFYAWADAADTVAFANGIPIQEYNRRFYVFPRPDNCPFSAYATIGDSPSRAWLPGSQTSATYTHEFGHNLGLYHASTLECGTQSIGDFTTYLSECRKTEYGDPYDVMGNYNAYRQFNTPHKNNLGWLSDQTQTASSSGIYTLTAHELTEPALKNLIIPASNSAYNYFVEFRKSLGFDQTIPSTITSGAQIRIQRNQYGETYLLDTTPNNLNYFSPDSFLDSSLIDGQSFTDTANGITITQLSHTNDTVTIEVKFAELSCRHFTPAISINPPYLSGNRTTSQTYQITITNTDTALCPPDDFNIYPQISYSSFITEVNPQLLTISPGFSQVAYITLIPRTGVNLGTYPFDVATYGNEPRHETRVSGTLELIGTIVRIDINPGVINTTTAGPDIQLSALAYDTTGQPIWSGVSYEWGISSQTTIGTLAPNYNIATFTPLNAGLGQVYVNARYGTEQTTGSILVTVTQSAISPSPSVLPTASPTTSPTPSVTVNDLKNTISSYLQNIDLLYGEQDGKVNAVDLGYYIQLLTP